VRSGNVEQLGRPLTLLPQRLPLTGVTTGKKEGTGSAFPKSSGKQCRRPNRRRHFSNNAITVIMVSTGTTPGIPAQQFRPWRLLCIGQSQHNTVISGDSHRVDTGSSGQLGANR